MADFVARLFRTAFMLALGLFVLGVAAFLLLVTLALVLGSVAQRVLQTAHVPLLLTAGLLVGFGTRLGNGCTSGHGVCGLSRLSPRSLVATLSFMGAGFASVYLLRHLLV